MPSEKFLELKKKKQEETKEIVAHNEKELVEKVSEAKPKETIVFDERTEDSFFRNAPFYNLLKSTGMTIQSKSVERFKELSEEQLKDIANKIAKIAKHSHNSISPKDVEFVFKEFFGRRKDEGK